MNQFFVAWMVFIVSTFCATAGAQEVPAEYQRALTALGKQGLENGLDVTARHKHCFWEEPRIYHMHVHGHGTPTDLARKLKPALDLIDKSGAGSATTGTVR